jgi:hypothetical protein
LNPKEQNRFRDQARERELTDLKRLLRQAMPPLQADQLEPRSDLWPQLRARLDSQHADRAASSNRTSYGTPIRVPWFDWALAALAVATLFFFPGIIPALLYHF